MSKRLVLSMCFSTFMTLSTLLYVNVASASPWLSSPPEVKPGEDLYVNGGGVRSNNELTVTAFDAETGRPLKSKRVAPENDGSFVVKFENLTGIVDITVLIDGRYIASKSVVNPIN